MNIEYSNSPERQRRELMIRLACEFQKGTLPDTIDKLPCYVKPSGSKPLHCCLAHDREVLRCRIMALLGLDAQDEEDDSRFPHEYLELVSADSERPERPLTVARTACSSCADAKIEVVQSLCRNCFAQTCIHVCPNNAINIMRGKAFINQESCVQCGKCLIDVCLYNAIKRFPIPCEAACPVGAIKKNEQGYAEIDFKKCTFCGKCLRACPYGAVMQRSELMPVLNLLTEGRQVVALVAPSTLNQFPGGREKLFKSLRKVGFSEILEVAEAAEIAAGLAAEEFIRKMKLGGKLVADSSCPAFVELVRRHLPAMRPYLSSVPSAMAIAGQKARELYPDAVNVFIGPCIAKRFESLSCPGVDRVITVEELGAILIALGGAELEPQDYIPQDPDTMEHDFSRTCAATGAMLAAALESEPELELQEKFIDGINAQTLKLLHLFLFGRSHANFIEVLGCSGGCQNGPCSLASPN